MIFQQNRKAKYAIEKTDNKNPFLCQEKNKDFFPSLDIPPLISSSSAWPFWLPSSSWDASYRMTYFCHLPQPFYDIDLFIHFKLVFVKSFLMDIIT